VIIRIAEVLLKKNVLKDLIELEDLVIIKELSTVQEDYEMVKVKLEEKPLKKALLKMLKKAKYLEEIVDVNKVKRLF